MDREEIEKYITMDSTAREGKESNSNSSWRLINDNKIPYVQYMWNFINILEIILANSMSKCCVSWRVREKLKEKFEENTINDSQMSRDCFRGYLLLNKHMSTF